MRIKLLALLVLVALMAAACGGTTPTTTEEAVATVETAVEVGDRRDAALVEIEADVLRLPAAERAATQRDLEDARSLAILAARVRLGGAGPVGEALETSRHARGP